jgi:hypothetical protein
MRPIRTERSNFTYHMPGDSTGARDLPCRIAREPDVVVYSTWELTPEERIAIGEGANIELGLYTYGRGIPPVSLAIDSTPREI